MPANRKEHLRFRYGICLNDGCQKCKSKEVQQIPSRKDFICEECQKPLRECPPPKTFWDKYGKLIIGGGVAVAALVALGLAFGNSSEKAEEPDEVPGDTIEAAPRTPEVNDSLAAAEAAARAIQDSIAKAAREDSIAKARKEADIPLPPEPAREPAVKPVASVKVPFGTYSGPANGLDGEIRVTRSYTLDLRNAAHESIELLPGDVITRTKFRNGELVAGYWQRGSEARAFHR